MKPSRRSLSAFLIATSALIAPHALAQGAGGEQEAAQQETRSAESIVVLGRYIPEPLQETSEVASFLTIEDLDRQGDSDAAAALARVTGLSIVEGKFVYVRGLGERYSSAILNGSPLPSPEPLQRVVPLDLFPTSILSGLMVQKSYSANYPGEFGGGIVELSTLGAPDYPFLEFGVSAGFNTESTLKSGITHFGSNSDVLGFDNGTRKVPVAVRNAIARGFPITPGPNFTDAELQSIGRSFVNAPLNLLQNKKDIPGNGSVSLSGGYVFDMGDVRLGAIGVLGYGNDWKTKRGKQQEGRVEDSDTLNLVSSYEYVSTDNDVSWDGLFGVGLEWGDHEIKWTNLYIRRTTKETYSREGLDLLAGEIRRTDRTAWYERELLSTQLNGAHGFGDLNVNWRAAHAETTREAPYQRDIVYFYDETLGIYRHDASRVKNSTQFSELTDKITSGGVDVSYAIPRSGVRDMVFAVGADHFNNSRSSVTRSFRFEALNDILPLEVQQSRVDFLLADFNIRPDRLVLLENTPRDGAAAYDAKLEVMSAYAKFDAELIPYVRTSLGARYENGIQSVTPIGLFPSDTVVVPPKLKENYILPAGTVTWNFYEDMQLRLGASQTIGRPQFRELAPQQYLDPDSDRLFFGNPYLRDTELTNIDTRYEYFFGPQQYFTVGAFYKDIERPIESVVNEIGTAVIQQTFVNAPRAELFGAEIEVKKIFDDPFPNTPFLAGKSFLVQANYTYADSSLKVKGDNTNCDTPQSGDDIVYPLEAGGAARKAGCYVTDGARMQGQSEHVANVQLGWEDDDAGSQATFILGYVSERISARGRPGNPDIIQEPGVILDFVYRRKLSIGPRPVTFSLKANNLLDEPYLEYQRYKGDEITVNGYDLGRTFSVGLSTTF